MMKPVTIREIIFFAGFIILAFFLFIKGCNTPIDSSKYISKAMFDASQDSLHLSRNALGQQVAETKLMFGTISDLKKLSSSKDSSIQKLIALVNKKTISATVVSNTTSNTVGSHTTITHTDTVRKDSLIYIYPTYTLKPVVTKWDSIVGIASRDSFKVSYKVFNSFDITQEFEKQKVAGSLFKKKVPVIKVLNLNPHTETRELKSFAVQTPKQKKGYIFASGVVIGLLIRQILLR